MNERDIRELALKPRDVVDITSHFQGETRTARRFIVVPYEIPRRCAATYYPESNVLVSVNSVAERSNTPTFKYIVITVAPSAVGGAFDYDLVDGR
jgi:anaerobic selenocysteine-containing dehydrogenase